MQLNRKSITTHFLFLLIVIVGSLHQVYAQQNITTINRSYNLLLQREINKVSNWSHTGMQPYVQSFIQYDSINYSIQKTFIKKYRKNYIARKLRYQHIVQIDTGDFKLCIDPILNVFVTQDYYQDSLTYYTNTRGIKVAGDIGKNFSFTTSFVENQSTFPTYLDSFVRKNEVVPGQARTKSFKTNGFDYASAQGNISYTFSKHYNIQFGHGKHFIGDGYRSLLLSNNSFNYPFLKLTANFKRWQYNVIYASFMLIDPGRFLIPQGLTEPLFQKKYATFHYLSCNVIKNLQVGFFQGINWSNENGTDNTPRVEMLNPIAFTTLAYYGLNGVNNIMAGVNVKLKILYKTQLYGQYVWNGTTNINETPYPQTAYQLGIKSHDFFRIKNMSIQLEKNYTSPLMYIHPNSSINYQHYNQSLTTPVPPGATEQLAFLDYKFLRHVGIHLRYSKVTRSTPSYGITASLSQEQSAMSKLYTSDYKLNYTTGRLYFLLNETNYLQFFSEATIRELNNGYGNKEKKVFVSVGIKMLLDDHYFDF